MKKLFFITAITLAGITAASAQTTKATGTKAADTVKKAKNYIDAPGKVFEFTLKVPNINLDLLKFALANAPLMETRIPANQLEEKGKALLSWLTEIERQQTAQHLADSTKAANPIKTK